jgi:asparagine synthase (glutamine-hydrolysing)
VHANPTAEKGNISLSTDVESFLPGDLLTKIDITTMSQSLEGRSPYLDHFVMQHAASLPFHLKVRHKETKYLLKKIASRYLPADVIYRSKQGFGAPIDAWLDGPLKPLLLEATCSTASSLQNFFDLKVVKPLLDSKTRSFRESQLLWSLLTLNLWLAIWHF